MKPLQAKEARIVLDPAVQNEVFRPLGSIFLRRRTQEQCRRYIAGLLTKVGRKNIWQLAEALGEIKFEVQGLAFTRRVVR